LQVRLLGGFSLLRDDRPIDLTGWQRRPAALLRLLAASGGRVTRDDVIDRFWPESEPDKGATNLRQVLYQLRRELGVDPPPVVVEGGWVALNPALAWDVDLTRFQEAVENAGDDLAALAAALDLYQGEPLPEDRYEDWAAPIREQAQQAHRKAVLRAVGLYRRSGEGEQALKRLSGLLDADPLDEGAVRLQIETLAEGGRRADALKAYTRFKERLRSDLDLEPEPETVALVEEIGRGERTRSARITGIAAPRQALPTGGFLGSLPVDSLVARDEEIQSGLACVELAEQGAGQLLLLAGEPGVGKTRLAQELTVSLRDRGFAIGAGSCYEVRETSAYFPFLEAMAMLYRLAPVRLRAEIPQRWPYLAALLPSENLPIPPAPSSDGSHDRLLWSVSGFLQALAGEQPVAILLDDLHWADSSSLDLLAHVAHHTRSGRVFILGTYRDVEVGRQHPLERTLHTLDRQGLVARIAVRRLSAEGTSALAAAAFNQERISEEFARILYQRTEGNPFFLLQVLRDLVDRGDLYQDEQGWHRKEIAELEVSDSIRSAVGQRLNRLSGESQRVLAQASVLGERFWFDDLLELTGHEERALEVALEEAEGAGLAGAQDGQVYAFDHTLTRQTIYAELSPRRKRRLHLSAGEMLEQLSEKRRRDRLAELAWHFLQADEHEKALRYSLEAGDAAAQVYAHADAELQYRTALDLSRELEDGPREALALERLASICHITSRFPEQLELTDRAAELYGRLGDLEGEGRVVARTARAYFLLGPRSEGIERFRELAVRFEGRAASPAHFALYEALVSLLRKSGRPLEAEQASVPAMRMALELGDDHTLARAWGRRALALSRLQGREAEAEQAHAEAVRSAEKAGDLNTLFSALNNAAVMHYDRGELDAARPYDERKLDVARRLGSPWGVAVALIDLSDQLYDRGDLAGWRSSREEALQIARSTALEVLTVWLTIPAQLAMADGAPEEAHAHLEGCLADALRTGNDTLADQARWDLAELNRLEGNLDAAHAIYETVLQRPDMDADARYGPLLSAVATLLEMRTDEGTETARRLLTEERSADGLALQIRHLGRLEALTGWLKAREGDGAEAARLMEQSLAAFRSHRLALHEGEILVYYGLMLQELGQKDTARERLTEAAELFGRIGHVMRRRRAERFLS
jgi:DNA-binding SARP family transcriptional activator